MAFEFSDFSVLTDYLITYAFGDILVLGVVIYAMFFFYAVRSGIPGNIAFITLTPLLAAFSLGGWLGASGWILTLSLVVLGAFTSTILLRIYT